jgi:hypothetical protein
LLNKLDYKSGRNGGKNACSASFAGYAGWAAEFDAKSLCRLNLHEKTRELVADCPTTPLRPRQPTAAGRGEINAFDAI